MDDQQRPSCRGNGGEYEESTGQNGAHIQVWRTCTGCGGSGRVPQ